VLHSLRRRIARLLDAAGLGDHFEVAEDEADARGMIAPA
jgi:hypothetical protein